MLNILKATLLAGLLAGLVVAGFTFAAVEPVIEEAIGLEESAGAAHDAAPPVVGREIQRGAGLLLGFELYGLTWGLLVGLAFAAGERWIPAATRPRRALIAAGLAFWGIALLPFVKYPANPPGAGDPETIVYRQNLYLALLALGCLGAVLAVAIARRVTSRPHPAAGPWLAAGLFLAGYTALVTFIMPDAPDAGGPVEDLVARFRLLSLAGLAIFWLAFGMSFARLSSVFTPRAP